MIYTVAALALSNQRMEKTIMNIAVFASHGGSDLQAIMDGCKNNQINAKVAVVISNNGSSMALQRVAGEGIPNYHLSAKKSGSEESLATEILDVLSKYNVDMIFLAGYMRMLHISVLERYNNRIFNILPALLPKFGGKGMLERDTLETLAARVLEREHEFLVEVIADIVNGKIPLGE